MQGQLGITPGVTDTPGMVRGMGAMSRTLPDVSKMFKSGGKEQAGTIGGRYLDPTKVPAWQRLGTELQGQGRLNYQDLLDQARGGAARSGNFWSSAREGQESAGASRIASDIATKMAEAGTNIYGQERGAQEAAAQRAQGMLPDVAQGMFGMGQGMQETQMKDLLSRLQGAQGTQALRDVPLQQLVSLFGSLGGQREARQPTAWGGIVQGLGSLLSPPGKGS
jgi:hypothetical protein